MYRLRGHEPDGRVEAASDDGITYRTDDGEHFATFEGTMDHVIGWDGLFSFADGDLGRAYGSVVFLVSPGDEKDGMDLYWIEGPEPAADHA